jgi:hypothetical protein
MGINPDDVTADTLTEDEIRRWEKSEVARLSSPGLRRKVGAIAAAELGHAAGIEFTNCDSADVKRSARVQISDFINSRKSVR